MILGSGSMVFGDGRGEKLIQPSSIRWIHEVLIDPPPGSRGERLGVQWPLDAHWTPTGRFHSFGNIGWIYTGPLDGLF
jgi:hypothetical protein